MRAVALIDFDNTFPLGKTRIADVEHKLSILLPEVSRLAKETYGHIDELEVRLYGGWLIEEGAYSDRAQRILGVLSRYRGRRNGTRVLPTLIMAPAAAPEVNLIGSYRASADPPHQKMVDCMVAIDAIEYARAEDAAIIIVSDDDDLVPAVLVVAAVSNNNVLLVRKRVQGRGLNDETLAASKVVFATLAES
jgi:hypothetical protein